MEELKNLSTTTKEAITSYYFSHTINYSIYDFFRVIGLLYIQNERKIVKKILEDMLKEIKDELCFELSERYIKELIPGHVTKKRIILEKMIKARLIEEVKYKKCMKLSFLGSKILGDWDNITRFIEKYRFLGDNSKDHEIYLSIIYISNQNVNGATEKEIFKKFIAIPQSKLFHHIDYLEKQNILFKRQEINNIVIKLIKKGIECYDEFIAIFEKIKLIDEDHITFLYNFTPKALDIVFEQTSEIMEGIEKFNRYLIEVLGTEKKLYYESYGDRTIFYMEIEKDCLAEIHICFIIPPRVVTLYRILSGEILSYSQSNELTREIMRILTIVFTRQSFHSPWMKYTIGSNLDCYIQSDLPFDNVNRDTIFFIFDNLFHEVFRFRKEIEPTIVSMVLGDEFKKISITDTLLLLQKGILEKDVIKDSEKTSLIDATKLFPEVPFARTHIRDMIKSLSYQESIINYLNDCIPFCFKDAPINETNVQDYVEILLKAKGYSFNREKKVVPYSTRGYKPDFTFENEKTVLEIKLSKNRKDVSRIIKEINDDIMGYQKEYLFLIFIVYDIGAIRDVKLFKKDIEKRGDNVRISVIKH